MKTNKILAAIGISLLFIANAGCGRSPQGNPPSTQDLPSENENPAPPEVPEKPDPSFHPLLWEPVRREGRSWSDHVLELINQHAPNLLAGAEDIETFCPAYSGLDNSARANFWGLLISAIVKYESNFNPTTRMHETTMGTDPVTGLPVYSEGLMQLSYQDIRAYPFCNEFDWDRDQHLPPNDPQKSILDPYKNLNCGVRILAQQIQKKNRITLSKGVYWAVLKINGKYTKIPQIAALTKMMPGCID